MHCSVINMYSVCMFVMLFSLDKTKAYIFHKVAQGEVLCSVIDSVIYQGDMFCLYVKSANGTRQRVQCDANPVSGDVKELKEMGNTVVCTVNRIANGPVSYQTSYKIPG